MAASGIAEHNEARRKERTMQKIAYHKKNLLNKFQNEYDTVDISGAMNPLDAANTYEREIVSSRKSGSPPGHGGSAPHDAAYVDRMRRNQLRQQQLCEYSAKIPNRFSSVDYNAQW